MKVFAYEIQDVEKELEMFLKIAVKIFKSSQFNDLVIEIYANFAGEDNERLTAFVSLETPTPKVIKYK